MDHGRLSLLLLLLLLDQDESIALDIFKNNLLLYIVEGGGGGGGSFMEIQKKTKHNYYYMVGIDEDIMIEIFLWLPVKSLNRFKSLSKRWDFLICHKNSFFRRDYLTNITTRGRKRIVGSYDHSPPIMAGLFFQPAGFGPFYEQLRFLPTCTEFVKKDKQNPFFFGEEDKQNPALSFLDYGSSIDQFLLCNCLHYDPDPDNRVIYIVASSNGFLLCSLEKSYPTNYCLVNPVTKEWTALPQPKIIQDYFEVGFVCKGDYPSLGSVEYTIVRATWGSERPSFTTTVLLEIFDSSVDDQWRQFTCSSESSKHFILSYQHNPVIVSSNSVQGGDGTVVYCLAVLQDVLLDGMHTVILVLDLKNNNNGQGLLQMIETPGLPDEKSVNKCVDHIAGFDGVIHYVRCSDTYIELWVLDSSSTNNTGEWSHKHRLSWTKMMEGCPWIHVGQWKEQNNPDLHPDIQCFHPMNPNIIFLTMDRKMVWCNFESGTLELVSDFRTQNLLSTYFHYAYQWPCWPPLL